MRKLLMRALMVIPILVASPAIAAISTNGRACWANAPRDLGTLSTKFNNIMGGKFNRLTINTKGEGYLQYPKVSTNWFMETGFEQRIGNHSMSLRPLAIKSDGTLGSTTMTQDTRVNLKGLDCNQNNECSFVLELQFRTDNFFNKQLAEYASFEIALRRTKGVYWNVNDNGYLDLLTHNVCS